MKLSNIIILIQAITLVAITYTNMRKNSVYEETIATYKQIVEVQKGTIASQLEIIENYRKITGISNGTLE